MFGPRSLAFALALSVGMVAIAADAAPTAKDRASAKTLWNKGKRLVSQKETAQAIEAFEGAVELDPKVQYELDLSRVLADDGRLIEAREHAEKAVRSDEKHADKAKKAAKELSATLGPRIPSLRVEVTGASANESSVTLDGEPFEIGVDAPVNPGDHTVEGHAGSQPHVTKKVDLKEGAHDTVTLELGAPKAVANEPKPSSGGGNMAPAAVAYAVGGAALAAGGITGGLAFMQTSTVTDECGGSTCPSKYADDVALAQDYGTASTVLFAVGGLGVAAGVVLTVTVGLNGDDDADDDAKKDDAIRVEPFFSPAGAGLRGTF